MKRPHNVSGQTLVIMLVITGFVMVIMSAALVMSLTGSAVTVSATDSQAASYWAEAGMENALMRFLRDPSYRGETLVSGRNSVVVTITGSGPYAIRAVATSGSSRRTVQATATFTNGAMSVTNWRDVY